MRTPRTGTAAIREYKLGRLLASPQLKALRRLRASEPEAGLVSWDLSLEEFDGARSSSRSITKSDNRQNCLLFRFPIRWHWQVIVYRADIVIFNPDIVRDTATLAKPKQYPIGIDYVFVNGTLVAEKGKHTQALPGKALTMKGDQEGK